MLFIHLVSFIIICCLYIHDLFNNDKGLRMYYYIYSTNKRYTKGVCRCTVYNEFIYISYVMMMSSVPRSDPLLLVLEDVGQLSSCPLNRGVHWLQVLLVFVGLYVVL